MYKDLLVKSKDFLKFTWKRIKERKFYLLILVLFFTYIVIMSKPFDKAKDIVWAIKLTAPLPGTKNSRKMEINYKNADDKDTWINGISGPSGSLNCADGGVIN